MRRSTGPDLHTVMAVLQRDGFKCARCSAPIQGDRGVHWVWHHRRPRAMGGSRRADTNSPANGLSLCSDCHTHIESHRAEALEFGWLVPQSADPASVAVLVEHGSRWTFLSHGGQYVDEPEAAA